MQFTTIETELDNHYKLLSVQVGTMLLNELTLRK